MFLGKETSCREKKQTTVHAYDARLFWLAHAADCWQTWKGLFPYWLRKSLKWCHFGVTTRKQRLSKVNSFIWHFSRTIFAPPKYLLLPSHLSICPAFTSSNHLLSPYLFSSVWDILRDKVSSKWYHYLHVPLLPPPLNLFWVQSDRRIVSASSGFNPMIRSTKEFYERESSTNSAIVSVRLLFAEFNRVNLARIIYLRKLQKGKCGKSMIPQNSKDFQFYRLSFFEMSDAFMSKTELRTLFYNNAARY